MQRMGHISGLFSSRNYESFSILFSSFEIILVLQLVNHGVDSSLVEKLKYEIQEFYKLPLEERLKYKVNEGDFEGYGQTIIHSEDQKVDWADRFYMIVNPINRRKPHLLPELPSSLRSLPLSHLYTHTTLIRIWTLLR